MSPQRRASNLELTNGQSKAVFNQPNQGTLANPLWWVSIPWQGLFLIKIVTLLSCSIVAVINNSARFKIDF